MDRCPQWMQFTQLSTSVQRLAYELRVIVWDPAGGRSGTSGLLKITEEKKVTFRAKKGVFLLT